jgi:hypothetical protein
MNRILLISLFLSGPLLSQTDSTRTTTFRLFAELSGGYYYSVSEPKMPMGDMVRDGMGVTARLKWGSSNLLGVGIETGWLPISTMNVRSQQTEFGGADIEASRSAVPLLLLFSMQRLGVQIHAGAGYYRVGSVVTMFGDRMASSEWDLGYMLSAGFARPVSDIVRLGAEVKVSGIVEQQLTLVSFQLRTMVRLYGE